MAKLIVYGRADGGVTEADLFEGDRLVKTVAGQAIEPMSLSHAMRAYRDLFGAPGTQVELIWAETEAEWAQRRIDHERAVLRSPQIRGESDGDYQARLLDADADMRVIDRDARPAERWRDQWTMAGAGVVGVHLGRAKGLRARELAERKDRALVRLERLTYRAQAMGQVARAAALRARWLALDAVDPAQVVAAVTDLAVLDVVTPAEMTAAEGEN